MVKCTRAICSLRVLLTAAALSGLLSLLLAQGESMSGQVVQTGPPTRPAGPAGAVSAITASTNGLINVMSAPYDAKCDGSTDDTAAFQAASNAAFATANPTTLLIPATGHACVISQWNLTDHYGVQATSPPYGAIHIIGLSGNWGQQSTIRCRESAPNSGVCVDLSGSNSVTIENLLIIAGATAATAPKVALLLARTNNDLGYSANFHFSNLVIDFLGQFGIYDYGGEVVNCHDCGIYNFGGSGGVGEAALVLSAQNTRNVSSPFQTLVTTPPVSMTEVTFGGQPTYSCGNLNGGCVEFDPGTASIANIKISGYVNLEGTPPIAQTFLRTIGSQGNLRDVHLVDIRGEANYATSSFASIDTLTITGFEVDGTFVVGPGATTPLIAFTNSRGSVGEGSIINLQPGDSQAQYPGGETPTAVVTCASGINIRGLVIYDRDAFGGSNTVNSCPGAIEFPGAAAGGWSIDGSGNFSTPGAINTLNGYQIRGSAPQGTVLTGNGAVFAPATPGIIPNPQTGTTYTVSSADRGKYVTFSNALAIAVTLPHAGTTGFTNNFDFVACAIGVGTATITPTRSQISYTTGSSYVTDAKNMALTTGQCAWVYSDNVNYFAIRR
jgi:hypothetical protein